MKKSFVSTALLVMAVFAGIFVSCKKSSGNGQTAAASSEPLEVLVWMRDIADYSTMEYYKNLEAETGIKANLTTTVDGSE
ncbi:MAG: hypothetical protein LBB68_08840 [Treponema sp.]|jgi:spermidine/putrescine-binding protein|nr:hypothetical protein [Treponema sp.]